MILSVKSRRRNNYTRSPFQTSDRSLEEGFRFVSPPYKPCDFYFNNNILVRSKCDIPTSILSICTEQIKKYIPHSKKEAMIPIFA